MSEEQKEGLSINFGLKSFEIISYDYNPPQGEIDLDKTGFDIQFKPFGNLNESTFSIDFKVIVLAKKGGEAIGTIQTRTTYRLSNMKKLINEDGMGVVPEGLAITLLSIALSTTRGAMAAKSEENLLSQIILPLVDPKQLYEASPLKGSIEIEG